MCIAFIGSMKCIILIPSSVALPETNDGQKPVILLAAIKPNLCHKTLYQKVFCLFSSDGFVHLYFCNSFLVTFVQVATVHSKLKTALDADLL